MSGGRCLRKSSPSLYFILFYLDLVSMLQLVNLSITVEIHNSSRPASPVSFSRWCGSGVIFR